MIHLGDSIDREIAELKAENKYLTTQNVFLSDEIARLRHRIHKLEGKIKHENVLCVGMR